MIYTELGRTGLRVSKLGFGTGGSFCLGQRTGVPEREIHKLIHEALALGYNVFDTSPGYFDSELILNRALKGVPRDSYILSDKVVVSNEDGNVPDPEEVIRSVERSLNRLGVDTLDILLVAGWCVPEHYEKVRDDLHPVIRKMQKEGKIRFTGSSEKSSADGTHEWLSMGLKDDLYDVVMAGYNIFNQSAERSIFPLCRENNVGVLNIYTVRNVFRDHQRLTETIEELKAKDLLVDNFTVDEFLLLLPEGDTLVSTAYKFAAANDAVSTIMVTSSSIEHLRENVFITESKPLPDEVVHIFQELFRKIEIPVGN